MLINKYVVIYYHTHTHTHTKYILFYGPEKINLLHIYNLIYNYNLNKI